MHTATPAGPTVQVELSHTLDPDDWAARHARGEVPSRVPYGLEHLELLGFPLQLPPPLRGAARQGARLVAAAAGGLRVAEAVAASRAARSCAVRLCWDENRGVPAAIDESRRRDPRPVATGVIWATDVRAGGRQPPRALLRAGLSRADAVFVLSSAQVHPLVTRWGVDEGRCHVLPFGVDVEFWAGSAPAVPGQVLTVGNDEHRDHELVVRAMGEVRREVPDAVLHLVSHHLVEVPPATGHRSARRSHAQLRDDYTAAELVVVALHPNLHVSGMTTALEAMAMGRPVVATATPGMEDYVVHGVTGLLVQPGDAGALARAVVTLLRDPGAAAQLGRNGREAVLARGSARTQAAVLARLLQTLL